jgi:hypothetical protein
MIKQLFKSLKDLREVFIPKSEFLEDEVELSIDDEKIECNSTNYVQPYIGVPAPAYLEADPWFNSDPVLSDKQMTVKESYEQAVADQQLLEESQEIESKDIHEKLYKMATQNWTTVKEFQGGSENFQEVSDGWQSGTGLGQFR